jgi:hypothetical protein
MTGKGWKPERWLRRLRAVLRALEGPRPAVPGEHQCGCLRSFQTPGELARHIELAAMAGETHRPLQGP